MNLQRQTYFSASSKGVPIRNIADYSPFGVQLDGRTISGDSYRYGFNGMEGDSEFKGQGNSCTTEFRQYDARLGRWLSLDPLMAQFPWQSPYCAMDNNPISLVDPQGDAAGGPGDGDDPKKKGSKTSSKSEKSKGTNPMTNAFDKVVANVKSNLDAPKKAVPKSNASKTSSSKTTKLTGNQTDNTDELIEYANKTVDYLLESSKQGIDYVMENASDAWNSNFARAIVPDYITIGAGFQSSSGTYMNEELTFTLMLRGKDPGLYFNTTTGFGGVSSWGFDMGLNGGFGYSLGDPRKNLSIGVLGGWQISATGGIEVKPGIGGSVNVGTDFGLNSNKKITTITMKISGNLGIGAGTPLQISGGLGIATKPKTIFKF